MGLLLPGTVQNIYRPFTLGMAELLQELQMTKEQCLNIIKLLSAMESVSLVNGAKFPDYLYEQVSDRVEMLTKEILK